MYFDPMSQHTRTTAKHERVCIDLLRWSDYVLFSYEVRTKRACCAIPYTCCTSWTERCVVRLGEDVCCTRLIAIDCLLLFDGGVSSGELGRRRR